MPRQKKNGRYLNIYLDSSIYSDFEEFCNKMGQSKTVATERALVYYMQSMSRDMQSTTNSVIYKNSKNNNAEQSSSTDVVSVTSHK